MPEPIAITGSACRFPGGASSPSKLWDLLQEPRDVLREFRKDELNLASFYHPDGGHHGATNVCNKGYLLQEDSRVFDAAFFNVNPAEAESMDPQQRITLEVVYEALESAGYTLDDVQGSQTSVYLGVMTGDYYDIQLRDSETIGRYHGTGTARSILSNRISYFFDLKGPSVTIDTACSSSLAALHFAVQSLRQNESTTAIVAGANIILDAPMYVAESKLQMLSPTSRSRMWDKSADGYARGEGFAAIILKTLSQAIKDGDHIECVIRETGMNSDGRTKGITMPSSTAQAALIRDTYRRAGLDPIADRPQFFECHGTGTQAGDPVEARAIHEAFFHRTHQSTGLAQTESEKLFCGSVKTVIGHTEGCAGLAGLLKASLAVQHSTIPPNLLFHDLNPAILPFYQNLEVPKARVQWPKSSDGVRRASVNSFGFGGTNVHAIVENFVSGELVEEFVGNDSDSTQIAELPAFIGPLVFSAQDGPSLASTVTEFMAYINDHPDVNLQDLAFVLQNRRTAFPTKISFAGATREKLLQSMGECISSLSSAGDFGIKATARDPSDPPAIIGIFTGQGAQWAAMGQRLIESCQLFRNSIIESESALANIPQAPQWSLMKELLANQSTSRVAEAIISQPLCTAIQIGLVQLLSACGIKFNAVVGHSSGEIAAVYAAGIISAPDAMRIAYYRGLHSKLSSGPDGKLGGMMAVGISSEAALLLCDQPQFAGRMCLAASNSPNSVTLSGDMDAIQEAKATFDDKGTFSRLLKVDTAYHSHHMLPASQAYLDSLHACNIQINTPRDDCVWISSVRGNAEMLEESDLETLAGPYWVENMVKPVQFLDAVECAHLHGGPFDLAIEVGPHPALKGPTTQIFKAALGSALPHAAFLQRGRDDLEAFSEGIGFCWSRFNPSLVDFSGYQNSFLQEGGHNPQKILKGLPSYSWNHDKVYWKESRPARNYRQLGQKPHEILGRRISEDLTDETRWRSILRLNELPWVRGHVFQGQTLFPTSGYMAMAIEAAKIMAEERPIRLIEVLDLVIDKALTMEENHPGVETIFSTKSVKSAGADDSTLHVEFTCYAAGNSSLESMEMKCSGQIVVTFGQPSLSELPPKRLRRSGLASFDSENYYASLLKIGLDYQGLFRGLREVDRTMYYANTKASWLELDLGPDYTIHPGPLDVAFHSIIAAYCTPESETLWAPFLPIKVSRLAIMPDMDYSNQLGDIDFDIETFVTNTTSNTFEGDIHIYNLSGQTGVQVEGLTLKMFTEARPSNDRHMFSKTVWDVDILAETANLSPRELTEYELGLAEAIDRMSLFYFQKVFDEITSEQAAEFSSYHQSFYKEAQEILAEVRNGKHPVGKKEWLDDKTEFIMDLKQRYEGQADLTLIHAVGENLSAVLRGETQLLEVMLRNNMLSDLYSKGRATAPLNQRIADLMGEITFKHPRTKILEIGAGTGGTTRSILDGIGDAYASYTYTDVSSGFFEKASERFFDHKTRMNFQVLNIEQDPTEQGFDKESYDVIIAANVLHATRKLGETLVNTRKLLKPGGYLIMMEVTGQMLEMTFLMGGLPGWWLGVEDGRVRSPAVSLVVWDKMLKEAGFTGVDKFVIDIPDPIKHTCSVILSQHLDEKVALLRDPLSSLEMIPEEEELLVIGGDTLSTTRLVGDIEKLSRRFASQIRVINTVDAARDENLGSNVSVICISELDAPMFSQSFTSERLEALQNMFSSASNVLWLTSGRLSHSAFSNMSVGLGRALMAELPQLHLQFLEVGNPASLSGRQILEAFLRLKLANETEFSNHNMLWVTEPEIMLNGDRLLIPRVLLDKERNDRFNSQRRAITRKISANDSLSLRVVSSNGRLTLQQESSTVERLKSAATKDVAIVVKESVPLPQLGTDEPFVLCLGCIENDERHVLAISKHNSSIILIPVEETFPLPSTEQFGPELLAMWACQLAVDALTLGIDKNTTVLAYGTADLLIARALQHRIEHRGGKCFFVGVDEVVGLDNYIQVHPNDSMFALRQTLPQSIEVFVDLTHTAEKNRIKTSLLKLFPVMKFDSSSLTTLQYKLLEGAYSLAKASTSFHSMTASLESIHVSDLDDLCVDQLRYPTVINWKGADQLNVAVKPLNFAGVFSPAKTYLMIGLTSDLGRSLCRWMVQNGAVHIVLASRNPNIDDAWLDEMRHLGANVKVYKMDVSSKDSVHSVCGIIKDTLPPIAGVCNGALVLSDKLFVEMNIHAVNDILKPKVDGSLLLHEYFKSSNLDFFILFSSISGVVGNGGQSNYNAASLFQSTLIAQRRAIGLAGSVLSLGMVTDVGYIAQRGPKLMERLKTQFYMPISEQDLHIIFGESILASKPDSDTGEIISGIQPFTYSASTQSRPTWFSNPRLSHLVREEDDSAHEVQRTLVDVNIREQLDNAESLEVAISALTAAFSSKLEAMLQMTPGTLNVESPLAVLGTDSLLAVEIRTWFLKEIFVDVPVLKILGGDTSASLCTFAAREYLEATRQKRQRETVQETSVSDSRDVARPSDKQDANPRPVTPTDGLAPSTLSTSHPTSPGTQFTSNDGLTDSHITLASDAKPEVVSVEDLERVEKMSHSQSRIWFSSRYLDDRTAYNNVHIYDINGSLQISRLKRALNQVLSHHTIFRTCFFDNESGGDPVQGLMKQQRYSFGHIADPTSDTVEQEFKKMGSHVWNLKQGDTFGATLITRSPGHHTMIFGYHHIIMDGFAWHLFLQDLNLAYQGKPLDSSVGQYIDLAAADELSISNGDLNEQVHYWKQQHSKPLDVMPLLPFSRVKTRKSTNDYNNHTVAKDLGSDLTEIVKEASRSLGITPFRFHLSVLQLLFHKLLGIEDMCIGVVDANRSDTSNSTIGCFINIMPIRLFVDVKDTFGSLVQRTSQTYFSAAANSKAPFDLVLNELNLPRSSTHNPLFQVVLNYRQGNFDQLPLGARKLEYKDGQDPKSIYDWAFSITLHGTTCLLQLTSRSYLYTMESTQMVADIYTSLLQSLAKSPSQSLQSDIVIKEWNPPQSVGLEAERAYWICELSNLPDPLPIFQFAKLSSRKILDSYTIRNIVTHLDATLVAKIGVKSQQAEATTVHFYLSALQLLLHRFFAIDDMCIGMVHANKPDKGSIDATGPLFNMLPLRFHVEREKTFIDLLKDTLSKVDESLGRSNVPFDTILSDLNITIPTIDPPIFQVLVHYRAGTLEQSVFEDPKSTKVGSEDSTPPYDLKILIDELDDGTGTVTFQLPDYLYDFEGSDLIVQAYLHILDEASADSTLSLGEYSMYDESHSQHAIVLGTGSTLDSQWPETLSLRIDDLIRAQPHQIAVKEKTGLSLTYARLSESVNLIAHTLLETGVIPGQVVAIFCDQGADMICSLLAILRIGGIYLPLDVRSSMERLCTVVTESEPSVIVCHSQTRHKIPGLNSIGRKTIDISSIETQNVLPVENVSTGSDPAFLLYTSGSSGKPKGILLSNSNYLTQVIAASDRMKLGKEIVLQQSALGFDASLAQIFYGLANGGTIVTASNRDDPASLAKLMLQEKITFTLCVPSEYSVLFQFGSDYLKQCNDWRVAMCGGEEFMPGLKAKFRNLGLSNLELFNAYGPTEAAVASSIGVVSYRDGGTSDIEKVPIGRSLPNYLVYVLDEDSNKPLPVGFPGEICIGGPGVALGYFLNDALTREKFVSDNITVNDSESFAGSNTLYRTGDRGRILRDGSVAFLGRIGGDSQIKLRGIRIELGEISSCILDKANGSLSDAVVALRGGIDQFLVAYVVFSANKAQKDAASYLRQLLYELPLPIYMRPAVAIPLECLPMTAAGKLDYKSLGSLPIPENSNVEDVQLSELETEVKHLWERVLPGESPLKISKHSDFFSVGGNSLLLLKLRAEIRQQLDTDISLSQLFEASTLKSLAQQLSGIKPQSASPAINWDDESSVPSDLTRNSSGDASVRTAEQGLCILLTGSTGFLGKALLRQLAAQEDVRRILCVAVRKDVSGKRRELTTGSEKIVVYEGDLSLPLLGLSEDEAAQVLADVDIMIHNGADVSFLKPFSLMRKSNVESTKELARLAIHRRVPVHFVSTAGIAQLSSQQSLEEVSMAPFPPPMDGSNGYVASKWASECFLEKINAALDLPVWIHRPTSIIGHDAPALDIMNNTLVFSSKTKTIPDIKGWKGCFDFISVDSVAKGIVGEALRYRTPERMRPPTYIHHSGEKIVAVDSLKEYLEGLEGGTFRVVSLPDWVDSARKAGMDELVAVYLMTMHTSGAEIHMPKIVTSRPTAKDTEWHT